MCIYCYYERKKILAETKSEVDFELSFVEFRIKKKKREKEKKKMESGGKSMPINADRSGPGNQRFSKMATMAALFVKFQDFQTFQRRPFEFGLDSIDFPSLLEKGYISLFKRHKSKMLLWLYGWSLAGELGKTYLLSILCNIRDRRFYKVFEETLYGPLRPKKKVK